jgi:biopolymer transport protein ExbD
MTPSLSPFDADGSGLPAERILTLSDITLIVLACMLALNLLILPLLDFTRVLEVNLPEVEGENAAVAQAQEQAVRNPVLLAQLADPQASGVSERMTLALDGRPVLHGQLATRLRQTTQPGATHVEFRGDAALTAQDIVAILVAIDESGLDLPGGVQIRVAIDETEPMGGERR